MTQKIRDLQSADCAAILRINREAAGQVFPLDPGEFALLREYCDRARIIECRGEAAGYVFAMPGGTKYPGDEYRWFCENLDDKFLYIDQIAIARKWKRKGLASALYRDVERHAFDCGAGLLACEIDLEPPNEDSFAFHQRLGFRQVSRMKIRGIVVSLQVKDGLHAHG